MSVARAAGFYQVAFLSYRPAGPHWLEYSTVVADLIGPRATPFSTSRDDYEIFDDLARAAVEQRAAGVPVQLSM